MTRILTVLMGILMAGSTLAGDEESSESGAEAESEPEQWQRYDRTGEVEDCISLHRIYRTDVWDNRTVFFEMRGKTDYVNVLDHECSSLEFEQSFAYSTALTRLCKHDLITVIRDHELRHRLDQLGGRLAGNSAISLGYPTCGLGEFIAVKEKPEEEEGGNRDPDQSSGVED